MDIATDLKKRVERYVSALDELRAVHQDVKGVLLNRVLFERWQQLGAELGFEAAPRRTESGAGGAGDPGDPGDAGDPGGAGGASDPGGAGGAGSPGDAHRDLAAMNHQIASMSGSWTG